MFTITEHKTETEIRVRFPEPVASCIVGEVAQYELVTAVITVTTWETDVNAHPEEPTGVPYRTVNYYGYRLNGKGQRDARQKRAETVPFGWVPEDVRLAVEAIEVAG
jgi:hypothetical protein